MKQDFIEQVKDKNEAMIGKAIIYTSLFWLCSFLYLFLLDLWTN